MNIEVIYSLILMFVQVRDIQPIYMYIRHGVLHIPVLGMTNIPVPMAINQHQSIYHSLYWWIILDDLVHVSWEVYLSILIFVLSRYTQTDVLLISSKQLSKKIQCPVLVIGDHPVAPSDVVRNIGVIMDRHASMEQHINSVCKAAYIHIYNIGNIRRYLTQDAAEQLVHAFITSKLDYCNSLLVSQWC